MKLREIELSELECDYQACAAKLMIYLTENNMSMNKFCNMAFITKRQLNKFLSGDFSRLKLETIERIIKTFGG
jgi:predicted transcriptional regulator